MIGSFVAESWNRYPQCPACVVGVHEYNRRSWRALERARFTRVWSGALVSEDPSDSGPQVLYVLQRPSA
jgi:aminoglycoside 6'-N-acetyltransferase